MTIHLRPIPTDLELGDVVRVKQGPDSPSWASDWREEYRVCALVWEFTKGSGLTVDVSIISDDEIHGRNGSTDGFKPEHLEIVRKVNK